MEDLLGRGQEASQGEDASGPLTPALAEMMIEQLRSLPVAEVSQTQLTSV